MIFVIGLGNPGDTYARTRHNIGFMGVNSVAKTLDLGDFSLEKTCQAQVAKGSLVVCCKPTTYMNASGLAVKALLKKYDYGALSKKEFSDVFVLYDDLDLCVGKYKLVFGSGPKVHNGVNSIKEQLGTDQFWHVRIGTDGRSGDRSVDPSDYVLSGFSDDEQVIINKVLASVVHVISDRIHLEQGS